MNNSDFLTSLFIIVAVLFLITIWCFFGRNYGKAKVANCSGTVTNPKTEARGVIKITCPKNLPSNRTVKVIHIDHGPLITSRVHQGGGGGEQSGMSYWKELPLFVTIPKVIQEGQIWEYKVEAPEGGIPNAEDELAAGILD
mmetsp:Transcript_4235/g.8577  ORF Transcript_4235/g.8577 Transcript_4235/m.8577 type:complete len:141 (+) Transcript_4235:480-902(+)